MYIEIHGFNLVIHGMRNKDVVTLCDHYLGLKFDGFTTIKERKEEYFEVRYKFPNEEAKESVYIKFKDKKPDSVTIVNLKGSYFDNSPDFRLSKLLGWLASYNWTPKQLDVAYVDDDNCLSIDRVIHWCENVKKYCTGSLFRNRPKILREEKDFDAIRLSTARSVTNYGTIYVRPDTGHVRIEIKFKNKDKILYLLDSYNEKKPRNFNMKSAKLLTSCIDFITAKTKKTRNPNEYVRQSSWRQFLGSDTKKVSFKQIVERRRNTRENSDKYTFDNKIKRTATMVKNMVERLSTDNTMDDIFDRFAHYCGYRLAKQEISFDLEDEDGF